MGADYWLIAKIMQRYWRLTRSLTLGAQGIVIDDKNRVLLVRHSYRPGWHFPGGGVAKNETGEAALARELDEEAGVRLDGPPQMFGVYANFRAFPSDHVLLYICRMWSQPVPPKPTLEITEHGFFALASLPGDLVDGARRRVGEVFEGRPRDENW